MNEINGVDYQKELWVSKHVEEFMDVIRGIFKDKEFIDEIAADLAYAYEQKGVNESTAFYDAYGLDYSHAVCVLDYFYDCYKQEVDEAYQQSLED